MIATWVHLPRSNGGLLTTTRRFFKIGIIVRSKIAGIPNLQISENAKAKLPGVFVCEIDPQRGVVEGCMRHLDRVAESRLQVNGGVEAQPEGNRTAPIAVAVGHVVPRPVKERGRILLLESQRVTVTAHPGGDLDVSRTDARRRLILILVGRGGVDSPLAGAEVRIGAVVKGRVEGQRFGDSRQGWIEVWRVVAGAFITPAR